MFSPTLIVMGIFPLDVGLYKAETIIEVDS